MMLTSSPRRDATAAVWVAGTGAFLLVAAAAVFVAHRWDQLPDVAKLGIVATLTGLFLTAGRAVRSRLPATGDVVFHLGAFLIPVDVAAITVHAGLDWRGILFAEGLAGVGVLGGLAIATRSVVLRWAATLSMAVLAVGIAGISSIAAPLALVAMAVVAALARQRTVAIATATAAGLAPLAGPVAWFVGNGVLTDLGLAGRAGGLSAAASGVIAAVVLGREARRRGDMALVAVAAVSLVAGASASWAAVNPGARSAAITAGAVFLLVELVAAWMVRDEFWRRVTTPLAACTEVVAILPAGLAAASVVLATPFRASMSLPAEPAVGTAFALAGVAWLVASWRRQAPPSPSPSDGLAGAIKRAVADDRTSALVAACAVAAVATGTGSALAMAIAFVCVTATYAISGGVVAGLVGAGAAAMAPATLVLNDTAAAAAIALVAAAAVVVSAVRAEDPIVRRMVALAATVPIAIGGFAAADHLGAPAATLAAAIALWLTAVALDLRDTLAGHLVRATLIVPVAVGLVFDQRDGALITAIVVVLAVIDSFRVDQPLVAVPAAVVAQLAIAQAAFAAGFDRPHIGVVLCVAATAPAGLLLLVSERWRAPLLTAAVCGSVFGLTTASADVSALGTALLVVGGMGVVCGVAVRDLVVGNIGGAIVVVGIALRLVVADVTASEPYLAPACAQLVVLGWLVRRTSDRFSSWVAYAPAVGLLGSAAIAERIDGGPSWHALVAGAVGVVAVGIGGWRRLAGPLFVGTGVLVAVTLLEAFGYVAGVPTWAWLATGGSALLATGIALERNATSPLEAGRRLVDVIADRYE